MKYTTLLLILMLLKGLPVVGQIDSMIVYDVKTRIVKALAPVDYDAAVTFDKTAWWAGTMSEPISLRLDPPTTNLVRGSEFTNRVRAQLLYDITDYPIRTAAKLFRYVNNNLGNSCSGILVGRNMVLTAAHCIRDRDNKSWRGDSMLITTGYDNGEFHKVLPKSIVSKYYIFKSYYMGGSSRDIALLELKEPIGEQTGWIGIGFSQDPAFFDDKVFHKLSYPADASLIDTSIHVNGDTLYYDYGKIKILAPYFIGVPSPYARGIPGQSGSSLFYTDHTDYYSMGILVYSDSYNHFSITNQVFYQFKNVIENGAMDNSKELDERSISRVYPNPMRETAVIEFDYQAGSHPSLAVFNSYGQMVRLYEKIEEDKVRFDRGTLPGGLYVYKLSCKGQVVSMGKIVVR